jgi:hypothetical protein
MELMLDSANPSRVNQTESMEKHEVENQPTRFPSWWNIPMVK